MNKYRPAACEKDENFSRNERSSGRLGMEGLMNRFVGNRTSSGSREEHLDSILSVYEAMAGLCQAQEPKTIKTIPICFWGIPC